MNIFEFTCDSARHTNSVRIQRCACLFLSKFPPYLGIAISLYYHAASPFIFGLGNHFFSPVSVVYWKKSIMQVDTHGIMPKRPQEVRRTCFLDRRKIPMGGNGRDSRLTTISKREHANIFLGWGSNRCFTIFQFGFLWPMSLLKQRNVPFSSFRSCQNAMAYFAFFFFVMHR